MKPDSIALTVTEKATGLQMTMLDSLTTKNSGKKLYIDFVNEQISDCIYTYRIENGNLILIDEQGVPTAFTPVG